MKIKNILILGALVAAGWYGYKALVGAAPDAGAPQHGAAVPVSAAEVVLRPVTVWSEFSGRLEPVDRVEIRPRVSGLLEAVHFEEGAIVRKGEKLFTIDPRPFEAELERAKAALTSAQATHALAHTNFERAQSLVKERAIPQSEYDKRNNDLIVAKGNFESAKAAVETAKLNVEYANITAPISGKINRAEITVGNYIYTSVQPPLMATIVSQSPIYADFEIDEATYLSYTTGNGVEVSEVPVELQLGNQEAGVFKGKIKSFDNQLNASSGTIRVRAIFDNEEGKLLPGLFARIRMGNPKTEEALLVNGKAVGTDQSKKFVWVVSPEGKAQWREVVLGQEAEGLRIVRSGLKAGEKVVVGGMQRIFMPDMPLAPTMVDMSHSADDAANPAPAAVTEATAETPADKAPEKPE
jgi:membrane fusion protein, multidrug efflux system